MIRRSLLPALMLAAGASGLGAQEPAATKLDGVEEQIEAHRYAEARTGIERWWAAAGDTVRGEVRARGLYLRAVLTEDLAQAERDLLRIAVEHPQSAFADRALLRVSHLRLARGDTAGGHLFLERLVQDHPHSPERSSALALLGRPERAPQSSPAATPARRPSPAASRPAAAAPAPPAAPPARQQAVHGYPVGAEFTVQVGSFGTVREAEALRERLRAGGFDAFLARVGGGSQTVVRVGSFRDRAGADALQRRLRTAGHAGQVMAIGQP